jgi:hypothetical protein
MKKFWKKEDELKKFKDFEFGDNFIDVYVSNVKPSVKGSKLEIDFSSRSNPSQYYLDGFKEHDGNSRYRLQTNHDDSYYGKNYALQIEAVDIEAAKDAIDEFIKNETKFINGKLEMIKRLKKEFKNFVKLNRK